MNPAHAQVWIAPRHDDPEAESALAVARTRLAAGHRLARLRRMRLLELRGALPPAEALGQRMHASIQFYNPARESVTLRVADSDPAPIADDETAVLVSEIGGRRLAAAERWWRHATGESVQVRAAHVWLLAFEPGTAASESAIDLAELRTRQQGLLVNPHVEAYASCAGLPPLAWIPGRTRRRA